MTTDAEIVSELQAKCAVEWASMQSRVGLPTRAWTEQERESFNLGYVAGLRAGLKEARDIFDAKLKES